jgi:hypothetical protein
MKYIIITLMLLASSFLHSAEERLGLDPILRGLWSLHAISRDGGATVDAVQPAEDLAVATATRITFADGTVRTINRVVIVDDDNGNPANIALLDNGTILVFTKQKGNELILVQVIVDEAETTRWVITVE